MATSYSIGKHFEGFIESLIASGRYSTASEVIAIQEGLDSGPSREIEPKTLAEEVEARGRRRLAAERLAAEKNG